jgi:tight adherence protein B
VGNIVGNINIILQYLLIFILLIVVFWLLFLSRATKKEKRLSKFTIDPISVKSKSFFDNVEEYYQKVIDKISNFLKKFKLAKKYGDKYEKYVDQSSIIQEKSIDYLSDKIVVAIIAVIITILSDILRGVSISVLQLIFSFFIGFFIPDVFLTYRNKRRKKQMEEDLLKAVTIMNNAFKSGRSTMQVIELVSEELTGPIANEFRKMYIDLTYGLELETVFKRFAKRVPLEDVKYMTSSLIILNKSGGDIVKIFASIERGFFDRKKLRQELKSITALSDIVFKILVGIPLITFLLIYIINPSYFEALYTTTIGAILIVLIIIIYALDIWVVKRVMRLEEW